MLFLIWQPVYQNEQEEPYLPTERKRTQSAPNLSEWPILTKIPTLSCSSSEDEEETKLMFEKQRMKRRKALSENLFKHQNLRTRSESDLIRIDRNATFNNLAYIERNELMTRVSDAFQKTFSQMKEAQNIDSTSREVENSLPRKVGNVLKSKKYQNSPSPLKKAQLSRYDKLKTIALTRQLSLTVI